MVSVVIPLYNKARHIRRAVESVLAQTQADFEVIVVDDGSRDGGGEIVRAISDPRIRMIVQENGGASAARNRGVAEARSNLIAFLDADDEWCPDFLETVMELRRRFPEAGLWGTECYLVRQNGDRSFYCRSQLGEEAGAFTGVVDFFASPSYLFTSSSVLVRKDVLIEAGLFPMGLCVEEDVDTWIRIALRARIVRTGMPKAIVHWDADNRSYSCSSGNRPFFKSVHHYYRDRGGDAAIPATLLRYLAQCHTPLLAGNWLVGNRGALREIVRDCHRIPGFRAKCYFWYCVAWIPYPLVRATWRIYRKCRGRAWPVPACRSRYRT